MRPSKLLVFSCVLIFSVMTKIADAQSLDEVLVVCKECHGAGGVSRRAGVPHLNGQLTPFLITALKSYADGQRPTMVDAHKHVLGHADAIAKFYSGQKGEGRPKPVVDPMVLGKGEKIYSGRCVDCHMDNGRDSDKDAPLMAGQDVEFLTAQTLAFKTGKRKFPFLMDDSYRGLSDEDLAAVAQFFAAQDQYAPATEKKKRKK